MGVFRGIMDLEGFYLKQLHLEGINKQAISASPGGIEISHEGSSPEGG